MNRAINLSVFETVRAGKMLLRYPTSSIVSVVVMTIVFVGLFETTAGIVGNELSTGINVDLTIQKFILWTTMIMGFSAVSSSIRDQTLSGLIETVWMGPMSPAAVLCIRGLTTIAITVVINLFIASVISLLYRRLSIFSVDFISAIALVSLAALGVGLILGAAVVVFKEIGPALNLLQFVMLPLFMNDGRYVGTAIELIAPGLYALRFLNGAPNGPLAIALAVAWLALGLAAMSFAVHHSRKNALVYQY